MTNFFRHFCRWMLALVVIIIGVEIIKNPEALAQLLIVPIAAICMVSVLFQNLLPKQIVSTMKKWTKKSLKRFWKFIF